MRVVIEYVFGMFGRSFGYECEVVVVRFYNGVVYIVFFCLFGRGRGVIWVYFWCLKVGKIYFNEDSNLELMLDRRNWVLMS